MTSLSSSTARTYDQFAANDAPVGPADQVLALLRELIPRWRVIMGAAVIAAAGVATRELIRPRSYTSTGSFIVQGGRSGPSLSGIASQFGISLASGGDGGQSPALYVDVLQSRSVLGAVGRATYCDPCGRSGARVPLARLLDVEETDSVRVANAVVRILQQVIGGAVNPKTGVVSVHATAGSPVLAQQLASEALAATQRFNLESRQSQASAERRFTEGRLAAVAAELRAAEQRLTSFRESNRAMGSAPELLLREDQLQREVRRFDEVYTALARTLEQSKIDELRDTPTIVVLDPPSVPDVANPRGTLFKAIFGALAGATLASLALIVLTLRRRRRAL